MATQQTTIDHILSEKYFPSKTAAKKPLLLLCGFGGRIWQTRRLINTLTKAGYDVTAYDFSKDVLRSGNATLLPELVEQIVARAEAQARQSAQPVQLVGISLGALLCLNILRRSPLFQTGVLITGGDIAKIAQKLYPKAWPQSYAELAKTWRAINMYSDTSALAGKRMLFVLHDSSKLIDVRDARQEIARQNTAGNRLLHTEHSKRDHVATIIEETVLFPARTLEYIKQLDDGKLVKR